MAQKCSQLYRLAVDCRDDANFRDRVYGVGAVVDAGLIKPGEAGTTRKVGGRNGDIGNKIVGGAIENREGGLAGYVNAIGFGIDLDVVGAGVAARRNARDWDGRDYGCGRSVKICRRRAYLIRPHQHHGREARKHQ